MSVPISLFQLVLAAALMLVSVLLSWRLRLGLGRDIVIAGTRMTVQLLLVGLILGWVFALRSPWPILGIGLVMTVLAAQAAVGRTRGRYPGIFLDTFRHLRQFVPADRAGPERHPSDPAVVRGAVRGADSGHGAGQHPDRRVAVARPLHRDLEAVRGAVEERLALGATRWEAAHGTVQTAVRTGMMPALNSMAVMGLVSLPGMMTGQILAGASPTTAVRYQIVIMFVLAASSALGSLGAVLLAYRALLDPRDRLRGERLGK